MGQVSGKPGIIQASYAPKLVMHFVAKMIAREAHGRASGADLDEELVPPVVQVLEGLLRVDIIDEHAAVRASVECHPKALEPFLPCCVPDLRQGTPSSGHSRSCLWETAQLQCPAAVAQICRGAIVPLGLGLAIRHDCRTEKYFW